MSWPVVTGLVLTYNHGRFIERAVRSVLEQTYPSDRLDVLVIDDGSTDDTPEILRPYAGRIRYIRTENRGMIAALNLGLSEVRGEIVSLLDGDDAWTPDRLRKQVEILLQRPEVGLVYGDMEHIDAADRVVHPSHYGGQGIPMLQGRCFDALVEKSLLHGGSMTWRASFLKLKAYFPVPEWVAAPDWWISLRIAELAEIDFVPDVVNRYRYHGANMTMYATGAKLGELLRAELPLRRWLLARVTPEQVGPREMVAAFEELDRRATWAQQLLGVTPRALVDPTTADRREASRLARQASACLAAGNAPRAVHSLVQALGADPWDVPTRAALSKAVAQLPPAAPKETPTSTRVLRRREPDVDRPRVLMVCPFLVDTHAGMATDMRETARELRALGADVDVSFSGRPSLSRGYDLVHLVGSADPTAVLGVVRDAQACDLPMVWQPVFRWPGEQVWASGAARAMFAGNQPEAERQRLLQAMAAGVLHVDGHPRFAPDRPAPDYGEAVSEVAASVDQILVGTAHEASLFLMAARRSSHTLRIVPPGLSARPVPAPNPARIRALLGGIRDFVLCVGAVQSRTNQLLLIEALRGTGVPVVLIGASPDPEYLEFCRQRGGEALVYLGRLSPELVASAYAAARVFARPAFGDVVGLPSLEAAAAGLPVVVGSASGEFERLGDGAYYCDPASVESIREAVLSAWTSRTADVQRRQALRDRVAGYGWTKRATQIAEVYRAVLTRGRRTQREPAPEQRHPFTCLGFAEELIAQPALVAAYAGAFRGTDRARLVVYAPDAEVGELSRQLEPVLASAGLDQDGAPDVEAYVVPDTADTATTLASSADALLTSRVPEPPFAGVPRFGPRQGRALRALAEARWAA